MIKNKLRIDYQNQLDIIHHYSLNKALKQNWFDIIICNSSFSQNKCHLTP